MPAPPVRATSSTAIAPVPYQPLTVTVTRVVCGPAVNVVPSCVHSVPAVQLEALTPVPVAAIRTYEPLTQELSTYAAPGCTATVCVHGAMSWAPGTEASA